MLNPMFVKGRLSFRIDGENFEFIHQSISVFGVTGLPWGKLSASTHFGREVSATIRISSPRELQIQTRAYIMRESTHFGEHMGLKFQMDAASRAELSELVRTAGSYPTDYLRKYPRIPADSTIQTFPLRVLALPEGISSGERVPIIMDTCNLSPNGILLATENQQAILIVPGTKLDLTIDPRGWFPMAIRAQGLVCRVVDELHPQNGNLLRYLGVKFTKIDDLNRTAFLDLLKDILSRIKSRETEPVKPPR